jgi:hypothetical protein
MRDHDPRRDREDRRHDRDDFAKKGQDDRRIGDHLDRGNGHNLAKNGDPSKHIGALGGKKDSHPALGDGAKDVLKGKGAPSFKDDHHANIPAPHNLKGGRLPFGKGKGK